MSEVLQTSIGYLQQQFSNRELAAVIWSVIAISALATYSVKTKHMREPTTNLVKAFFNKKIISLLVMMLGYVAMQVYFLCYIGLWDFSMLGSTVTLFLVALCPLLFKFVEEYQSPGYLTKNAKALFTHLAVLEYIIGLKSFVFWIEFFITPIVFCFAFMYAFSEKKRKFKSVNILTASIIAIFMLIFLAYSFWHLISDWRIIYLWDFFFVVIMSITFMPFLYVFGLIMSYENAFIAINSFHGDNHSLNRYAYFKAILSFRTNTIVLNRWIMYHGNINVESKQDVDDSIKFIKECVMREKNPESVSLQGGWSPHEIKDCLAEHGLPTRHYRLYPHSEDEWGAGSDYLELSDVSDDSSESLPNNIAFYVGGGQDIATELKLVFNCNSPKDATKDIPILRDRASDLCMAALESDLPNVIENAIEQQQEAKHTLKGKELIVKKENYLNNSGFEIHFIIKNP